MDKNSEKNQLIMADIIAKAWNEPKFKKKLIEDPKSVLKSSGIEGITDDIAIRFLENTATRKYVVLPPADQGDYVSETIKFFKSKLPLPLGMELSFVQNTDNLSNIVLPIAPPSYQGKLDASHAQVLASAGWEAINLYTTANAVAEANAAAVQNVAGATEAAAAAVALVVVGVVI